MDASEFKKYLPTRRFHWRPPRFTRSGSMDNEKIRHQPWLFPPQPPEEDMVRRMFCKAIAVMIKRTMELHNFQIDGTIYRQKEGGAIGMDLTGVVSDIYMCEWDRKVCSGLEQDGIKVVMYKRYKDEFDIRIRKKQPRG